MTERAKGVNFSLSVSSANAENTTWPDATHTYRPVGIHVVVRSDEMPGAEHHLHGDDARKLLALLNVCGLRAARGRKHNPALCRVCSGTGSYGEGMAACQECR